MRKHKLYERKYALNLPVSPLRWNMYTYDFFDRQKFHSFRLAKGGPSFRSQRSLCYIVSVEEFQRQYVSIEEFQRQYKYS